jgi:hypothetical protein
VSSSENINKLSGLKKTGNFVSACGLLAAMGLIIFAHIKI